MDAALSLGKNLAFVKSMRHRILRLAAYDTNN
jgi:hypothetical protein